MDVHHRGKAVGWDEQWQKECDECVCSCLTLVLTGAFSIPLQTQQEQNVSVLSDSLV